MKRLCDLPKTIHQVGAWSSRLLCHSSVLCPQDYTDFSDKDCPRTQLEEASFTWCPTCNYSP